MRGSVRVVQVGLAVTNVRAQEAKARTVLVIVFKSEQHAATEGRGAGLPMVLHVLDYRFVRFLKAPMNSKSLISTVLFLVTKIFVGLMVHGF